MLATKFFYTLCMLLIKKGILYIKKVKFYHCKFEFALIDFRVQTLFVDILYLVKIKSN